MARKTNRKRNTARPRPLPQNTAFPWVSWVFFGLCCLITLFIINRGLQFDEKVFNWSMIPLFMGLLLEAFYVIRNTRRVINCFSVSFFASLVAFLPGKNERYYSLQNHIEFWPYAFLIAFIIGIIVLEQEKVTARQTEGTVFLLSLAFMYWLWDYRFFEEMHLWSAILIIPIGVGMVITLLHALTRFALNKTNRLFLSIWSSAILCCFAVDNIIRVYSNGDLDRQESVTSLISLAIQYFLMGVSSVYVVQNIYMLFAFLPQKNTRYRQTLYIAKKMHLDRFQEVQVVLMDVLFCMVFCALVFAVNHHYAFLPRPTVIWLVVITFPFVLAGFHTLLLNITRGGKKKPTPV